MEGHTQQHPGNPEGEVCRQVCGHPFSAAQQEEEDHIGGSLSNCPKPEGHHWYSQLYRQPPSSTLGYVTIYLGNADGVQAIDGKESGSLEGEKLVWLSCLWFRGVGLEGAKVMS